MPVAAAPLPKPLASEAVHPVDEVLAAPRLIALGIQHVLVMYAGAVAVPLIVGAAVKAPREQVAFLITCDLLACGIASLLQSVGVWRFRHSPAGHHGCDVCGGRADGRDRI